MRLVLIVAIVLTAFVPAGSAQPAGGAPAPATAEPALVFERYMTPRAGAATLAAIQRELARAEDRVLPLSLTRRRGGLALLVDGLYRAGTFVALDVPQDHMLLVVGHEVFGHGARLRELGSGRLTYSFDAPRPYGPGGAETRFSGALPDTPLAFAAIETSGIEAQHVMADGIGDAALGRGRMHYREAWLYFENRVLAMDYITSTRPASPEGHDVADFLRTFREACAPPGCQPPSRSGVKRGSRLTLADPLLYYAVYGFAGAYVGRGRRSVGLPMIRLGRGIGYLPSLGYELRPYGTEYVVRNLLAMDRGPQERQFTRVTVRVGNTGAARTWGAGVRSWRWPWPAARGLPLSASFELWRQPATLADRASAPLRTGALAAMTASVPLRRVLRASSLMLVITAGYKSDGFVPGERLGPGVILRAGVSHGV